jgi:transposase
MGKRGRAGGTDRLDGTPRRLEVEGVGGRALREEEEGGATFQEKFTWKVFLKFLRRLVQQIRRKVFLILDGHSAHKAKDIQPWLARNRGRLRLFFLPGYSPELNPDELLNQDLKSNAVGRRPPLDAEDLMSNVRGYVRSTQRMPHVVRSFFDGEHVDYAG